MELSREQLAYDLALIHARTKFEQVFLDKRSHIFAEIHPENSEPVNEYNFISSNFYYAYLHFLEDDQNLDCLFGH